jgi:hypothetical protein
MSWQWAPEYRITLARPPAYGATSFTASWRLQTLIRGDFSLPTANGVGQASLQFSDLAGALRRKVNPQPMDVLRIEATGRTQPKTYTTVWTGYLDTVTERYDTQQGASLVLDATTPFKLFEMTTQALAAPADAGGGTANEAFALALAQLQGIGARALIGYVARTCRYPGSVGALHPNPANLQLYSGPEYVGQRSFSLPDNAAADPDLQTYAAILSGLVADTGMELYCDEYGSLVWRPLGYLSVPTKPYRLEDDDILEAELGRSDQGVASQVRVRWAYDSYYAQDGYAPLPKDTQFAAGVSSLQRQLGARVHVIDAPWVQTPDAANFLARAVLEQLAAGVAVGTISIPTTPQIRIGTVIDVPPLTPGLARGYYYVLGKTSSWQWGGAWTDTLTLAYGRDPTAGFPYIGAQAAPNIHSPLFATSGGGGAAFTGHATLAATATGQLAAVYLLRQDAGVPERTTTKDGVTYGAATGPFPQNTIVRVRDGNGHDVGSSPNGEYVITATSTDGAIHLRSTGGVASTSNVVVVRWGTTQDAPTPTPAPAPNTPTTNQTGGKTLPTPASFPVYPIAGVQQYGYYQPFGPTSFPGEPTACGVPHFHLGVDISRGVGTGTPIRAAIGGVVVRAGMDSTGYGMLTVIETGTLWTYYGHQGEIDVQVGDVVRAGTFIGKVDSTGKVTGPHLHFGVQDRTTLDSCSFGYVNPAPYLLGSRNS